MSSICNLVRGNTLKLNVGIADEIVTKHGKFAQDYSYIEFGVDKSTVSGKFKKKIEAGDVVSLKPTCSHVRPYKFKVLAEVNPELYKAGLVSAQRIFDESSEPQELSIKVLATKDFDINELDYLLRIYLQD